VLWYGSLAKQVCPRLASEVIAAELLSGPNVLPSHLKISYNLSEAFQASREHASGAGLSLGLHSLSKYTAPRILSYLCDKALYFHSLRRHSTHRKTPANIWPYSNVELDPRTFMAWICDLWII